MTQRFQISMIVSKYHCVVISFDLLDKFSRVLDLNCYGVSAKGGIFTGHDLTAKRHYPLQISLDPCQCYLNAGRNFGK